MLFFTQTPSTTTHIEERGEMLQLLTVFSHSNCFEDRNTLVFTCQMLPFVQNTKTTDVTVFLALSPTVSISPLLMFCSKWEVIQKQIEPYIVFISFHSPAKNLHKNSKNSLFLLLPLPLLTPNSPSFSLFLKHLPSDKASQKEEINFERH